MRTYFISDRRGAQHTASAYRPSRPSTGRFDPARFYSTTTATHTGELATPLATAGGYANGARPARLSVPRQTAHSGPRVVKTLDDDTVPALGFALGLSDAEQEGFVRTSRSPSGRTARWNTARSCLARVKRRGRMRPIRIVRPRKGGTDGDPSHARSSNQSHVALRCYRFADYRERIIELSFPSDRGCLIALVERGQGVTRPCVSNGPGVVSHDQRRKA
jgi:hypothetical protein